MRKRRAQCRCRRQLIAENLIEDPEDTVDLDLAGFSKSSDQRVASQQNTPLIDLCQCKRKPIVDG